MDGVVGAVGLDHLFHLINYGEQLGRGHVYCTL